MRYHCFIDLKRSYHFPKDLLNAIIPINVNGVYGNLFMPDNIDDIRNGCGNLYYKLKFIEKKLRRI